MIILKKKNLLIFIFLICILLIVDYFNVISFISNLLDETLTDIDGLLINFDGLRLLKRYSNDLFESQGYAINESYIQIIMGILGLKNTIIFFLITNLFIFIYITFNLSFIRSIKQYLFVLKNERIERMLYLFSAFPIFFVNHLFIPSKEIFSYALFSIIPNYLIRIKNKKGYSLIRNKIYLFVNILIGFLALFSRNHYLIILLLYLLFKQIPKYKYLTIFLGFSIIYPFLSQYPSLQYETFLSTREFEGSTFLIMNFLDNVLEIFPFLIVPICFLRYFFDTLISGIISFNNFDLSLNSPITILIKNCLNFQGIIYFFISSIYFIQFSFDFFKGRSSKYFNNDVFSLMIIFILVIGLIPFSQFRYYFPLIPLYYSQMNINKKRI